MCTMAYLLYVTITIAIEHQHVRVIVKKACPYIAAAIKVNQIEEEVIKANIEMQLA